MNSVCPACGRSFTHDNTPGQPPTCPECAYKIVSPAIKVSPGLNPFLLLEYCAGCGEAIRPHWKTCPVCQTPLAGETPRSGKSSLHGEIPLRGEIPSPGNPFSPPVKVEKEVRQDLKWAGIAMICLAVAGFAGFLLSLFRREWSLMSDDAWFGPGAVIFAAMVGGGLVGASKQKQGAAAKGVLKGLMYSVGAIFVVMAITILIVVCLVLFLIVACMTSINK